MSFKSDEFAQSIQDNIYDGMDVQIAEFKKIMEPKIQLLWPRAISQLTFIIAGIVKELENRMPMTDRAIMDGVVKGTISNDSTALFTLITQIKNFPSTVSWSISNAGSVIVETTDDHTYKVLHYGTSQSPAIQPLEMVLQIISRDVFII